MQTNKHTNFSLYGKNYVHQFLIFFVRNSFEPAIKRPSPAGSTLQCDRRGPVAKIIRAQHSFQNTLISQQRTSQMIRWSPPGL